ncbi:MAG: DctP family TRAP transporter solute-binding subunit [Planctomycetaceae bacterium]|nr:DctP family TRAP transporter solute-binding subunit [Planctomycetaceae bacterium]
MKKALAVLAFTVLATSLGVVHAGQRARELRMSVTTSETSVWMVAAREFKRIVEEKTEGRYKVSIYPNEQLSGGDMVKGVEQLFTGVTDLDIHSTINMTGFEPKLNVVNMPWIFPKGYESVDEIIYNGPGLKMITDLIEAKGAVVLGLGEVGFRQLTNNRRPVNTVEDMQQLKIRVPAIKMYVDSLKEFGADPTAMNFAEVFTALQQGTIDGQENPLDTIRSGKIQEVQKYCALWNWSYDPIALSVSTKTWRRLSDEDKAIFKEAGQAACKLQKETARTLDAQIVDEFKAAGVEFTTPDAEAIAGFKKAAGPVYASYRERVTDEVFAAFGYTFE